MSHSRTSWNFVLDGNILAVYFGKVKGSRRHRPSILGHYGSLKSIVVAFFSIFWFTIHKCDGDWAIFTSISFSSNSFILSKNYRMPTIFQALCLLLEKQP